MAQIGFPRTEARSWLPFSLLAKQVSSFANKREVSFKNLTSLPWKLPWVLLHSEQGFSVSHDARNPGLEKWTLKEDQALQEGISVMWRQYRPQSGHIVSSHIPCSGTEVILSCGARLWARPSRGNEEKHIPPWDPYLKAVGLVLGTKSDLVMIILNMHTEPVTANPLSPPYAYGLLSSSVSWMETENKMM